MTSTAMPVDLHSTFLTLEDRMCRFGTAETAGSPNRVDALVWVLMMEGRSPGARVII